MLKLYRIRKGRVGYLRLVNGVRRFTLQRDPYITPRWKTRAALLALDRSRAITLRSAMV